MRSKLSTRATRRLQIATGAFLAVAPVSAVALANGPAGAQSSDSSQALQVSLDKHVVPYGRLLTVRGQAPTADRGRAVELQFQAPGSAAWRNLRGARVHTDGSFRLRVAIGRSGTVRVAAPAAAAAASADHPVSGAGAGAPITSSGTHDVIAGSHLSTGSGSFDAAAGQGVHVNGALLPRGAGRTVALEARAGHGWRRVAFARTRPNGHFTIKWTPSGTGGQVVRVHFAGDRQSAAQVSARHQVMVMRSTVASWYNDAGNTACGFHAGLGVANKTLPCGTKVTFRYGGRTVVATVDDRGPFVSGRDYDLNQNTAAALGFDGVATVQSSI